MDATPKKVLVLGAGKIGRAVAEMLSDGGYQITIADRDAVAIDRVRSGAIVKRVFEVDDEPQLMAHMAGHSAVISALPYTKNLQIGTAALAARVHYFDMTEDVELTRAIRTLAAGARTAFVPQCGLAPGFVCIAGNSVAQSFDQVDTIELRVGALPKYPTNSLGYNLTWSTEGLINQYCNPCETILDGSLTAVRPLEDLETVAINGRVFEAFNTSGGLGTLCDTWAGKLRNLNYKTMRYPGHRELVNFLLRDLRMIDDRKTLIEIFERALPLTQQDIVVLLVSVRGMRNGRHEQECLAVKIDATVRNSRVWTAIELATAAGTCAMVELLFLGRLPSRGFVRQEDASLDRVLATQFGGIFSDAALPGAGTDSSLPLVRSISALKKPAAAAPVVATHRQEGLNA
jgi:saccharopine dehydrogenase-like NADP-dependent oxidoreductase